RLASDPFADREEVRQRLLAFHKDYPEVPVEGELQELAQTITDQYDQLRNEKAQRALTELDAAEKAGDLDAMVAQALHFLKEHGRTPPESSVRTRLEGYLKRLDERDFEDASTYSVRSAFHFQTRKDKYLRYLEKHPEGRHAQEALQEVARVEEEWDRHDFRQ